MKTNYSPQLFIGTSGIALPVPKINFPESFRNASRLHYYGTLFNTLEVNSTFYKIPKNQTIEKWIADVPENFLFTVKLWREITHQKKLSYRLEDLQLFAASVHCFGAKKGCLLVQFPASISIDQLSTFKKLLGQINGLFPDWKIAVEFRHSSWYTSEVYEVLLKYKATLVIHDIAASRTPLDFTDASWIYMRFHGPTGNYRGTYTDDFLKEQASNIKSWLQQGKSVFVYFNNTMGSAFQNAQFLKKNINL